MQQMILFIILHGSIFDYFSLNWVLAEECELLSHFENAWLDLLLGFECCYGVIFVFAAQLVHPLVNYLSNRLSISLLANMLVFALAGNKTVRLFRLVTALLLPEF